MNKHLKNIYLVILCFISLNFSVAYAAPTDSLSLDSFENGLRTSPTYGYQYWKYLEWDSSGTVGISQGEVNAIDGTNTLKVTATQKRGNTDIYTDFQPWTGGQGDSYTWEKAVDVNRYTTGKYHVIEFWMYPDSRFHAPKDEQGGYAELSFGTYTMASALKGQGSQENGGYHGYHSLHIPTTNGRWVKLKMMRPGGFRSGANYPAARATVATSNNIPFTFMENIVSSSGAVMKFTNEYDGKVYSLSAKHPELPLSGDTITGETSGAVRTLGEVIRHYPEGNSSDLVGKWTGYDISWVQKGGTNVDWYKDYPNTTTWDRLTRFYVANISQPAATAPSVTYLDDFRFLEDDRDDQVAVANIGAFYDPATSNLYVTWERNKEMYGKVWEVRVAYSDIHNTGLSNATVWKTIRDSQNDYSVMSLYGNLNGTNGRPLYISVRPLDRDTFAQIMIPTSSTIGAAVTGGVISTPPPPPTPNPTISLVYNGKTRDVVGVGKSISSDGANDASFTTTLSFEKRIISLNLDGNGVWNTIPNSPNWVIGVANTSSGPLINKPDTSIDFTQNTFHFFASDDTFNRFAPGNGYSLTVTFYDNTTAAVTLVIPAQQQVLIGDLNSDKIVNSLDWSLMNAKWFTSDTTADLNKDGLVNAIDFSLLNANWFKTLP